MSAFVPEPKIQIGVAMVCFRSIMPVHYRGTSPAMIDLIARQINVLFEHAANSLPHQTSRLSMKPAVLIFTLRFGTAYGLGRAHPPKSSRNRTPRHKTRFAVP
jgi:hypothetical protein